MPLLLSLSSLLLDLVSMGTRPQILEQDSVYEKIALTDSTTLEVYKGDTVLVVFTACTPQCSSIARVYYKKEWTPIQPPFESVFPLATIDRKTGRIQWTDNDTWEY